MSADSAANGQDPGVVVIMEAVAAHPHGRIRQVVVRTSLDMRA